MSRWKIAAAVAVALTGSAAAQYTDYQHIKIFYSDYTKSQTVGYETWYCDHRVEMVGVESEVYEYQNGLCP